MYEGQMRYIPEEVKEDKNFVEKIVYVSPIRHAEGNFYLSQILAYPEMYEQMLQVLKEYDEDGKTSCKTDDEYSPAESKCTFLPRKIRWKRRRTSV